MEGLKQKATGRCEYTSDIVLPGMLVAKALYPQHPRAKIKKLDVSAAETIPGVIAIVTHHDLPDKTHYGILVQDQQIFAIDEVCYIGDIVALVAAETEDIANQALKSIEVEYDPLPGIFDPVQAVESNKILARKDLESNLLSQSSFSFGDVDQGFSKADVTVKRKYQTQCMDHLFLETEGVVASWDGSTLVMYISGQDPHGDRNQVAAALGLPINQVRVIYPYVGGGFGGKEEMHVQIQTAVLAMKAKRPVKFIRTRQESLFTHIKRAGISVELETAAKADGTLLAIRAKIIGDSGPYSNIFPAVINCAAELVSGPYKIPNAQIDSYAVATNNLIGGGMRGFGGPEVAFAYEQNIDLLAEELGIDPLAFRLKNGMEKGTVMPSGTSIPSKIGFKETIHRAAEASGWDNRQNWLEREPEPGVFRGLGAATIWHGMGMGRGISDHSAAVVEMTPDGSILLSIGVTDMGQGAFTAQKIIVANELGVDPEDVIVNSIDTHLVPAAGPTSASSGTYRTGKAIIQAAGEIKQNLLAFAANVLEAPPEELILADKKVWVEGNSERFLELSKLAKQAWWMNIPLRAEGFSQLWHPDVDEDEFNIPHPHSIFAYAAHIAQVLVDTKTGKLTVEKIWAAHDVGKAINRQAVEGQIEGGVVQGLGYALLEELHQHQGKLLNKSLSTYLTPLAQDVPEIEPIIIEVPEPTGPYGAKGIGEPPLTP
ncbi:MAG: xanthine dehydrogenase family protein molybdopterin-binding subunit, partial [Chloroflexota bacterium]